MRIYLLGDVLVKALKKDPQSLKKRPRFWLGPLLAGGCFAFSYGMTHRLLILGSQGRLVQKSSFDEKVFPGIELNALRNLHGGKSLDLLPDHHLKQSQGSIKVDLDSAKSNSLGAVTNKVSSEVVGSHSTKPEIEQLMVNQSENVPQSLPVIPWIPKFPSQRTFSIPQELPRVVRP